MPHSDLRLRAVGVMPGIPPGNEPDPIPLSPEDRAELVHLAQIITYKAAGSLIYAQGDTATHSFLLADGLVRISHTLADGERQIVAFHWPGDLLGLAPEGRYINAAETIGPARLYRFQRQELAAFLLQNPRIQNGFLVKATHDLRALQRQLIVLGRYDISRRLAVFLLDCAAHPSYFNAADAILTLPMSRDDIADYLGTSAETITRSLARLESEGQIERLTARRLKLSPERLSAGLTLD
jgi:CRP-like cAMP-binding protein